MRGRRGRRPTRAALAGIALLVGVLVLPVVAWTYVPSADRIANAVAQVNRKAGRGKVLEIQVDLQMGNAEQVAASGVLLSDPDGVARLELRSPRGTVERHLMRGAGLRATRQGEFVDRPRPFLPPLFLLQASSSGALRTGLVELGARSSELDLGYDGAHDCYVFGGRDPAGSLQQPRASLWVEQGSLATVRIDLPGGARFRFGPPARFGKISLPAWIDLHQGGARLGRLTVTGAASVRPPPGAFDPGWLLELPPAQVAPEAP